MQGWKEIPACGYRDPACSDCRQFTSGDCGKHGPITISGYVPPNPDIVTRCPSCGHGTLFIGHGGHLTCSWLPCKEPGVEFALKALKARLAAVDDLVLWALGEIGEDFPGLPDDWPKRKFYWRKMLRAKFDALLAERAERSESAIV